MATITSLCAIWIVFASAIVAFILHCFLRELYFSPLQHFPGPLAAKFTDLYRAFLTYRGHVEEHHRAWHAKYGAAVRIGPDAVMLNDPALIKQIYTTKSAWRKTDFYRPNDVPVNGQRVHNLFNAQDQKWYDHHKRPIGSLFNLSKVLEMEHLIDETIEKFISKMNSQWLSDDTNTKVVRMDEWLAYFAWDSICEVTYGQHYGFIEQGKDVDNLIQASKAGLCYFATCSQIPWVDNYLDKNPYVRIGPRPLEEALVFSARLTAQYQASLSQDDSEPANPATKQGHLLERYFKAKETYPEIVGNAQIIHYTLLSIGAGGDTTAAALRAALYLLAKHPQSYDRVSEELTAAQLSTPVSYSDAKRMPYLDACIRESMRLVPGIALMPEREVPPEGFTLPDGRVLPSGTKVGINPAVTNRDTSVFGTATDQFIPERWLQGEVEDDKEWSERTKAMDSVLDFTFGSGKRICIGRNIARLEVWKLTATLLTLFDIRLVDPDHEWRYENYWFVYQCDMPMIISRKGSPKV